MPEKSGTAPRDADCPSAGAVATTEITTAFNTFLSLIAPSQRFATAMLHGFTAGRNPALSEREIDRCRTTTHVVFEQTDRVVAVRFSVFFVQVLCMFAMGISVALRGMT